MNFKQRKNKSLHLAHSESGYLCFFKANPIVPPLVRSAGVQTGAKIATEAGGVGAKVLANRVAGAVAGPVGIVAAEAVFPERTAIGTFGATPENTFNFTDTNVQSLEITKHGFELNGNSCLPPHYSSINLAPDVNIGFDKEKGTFTLYHQGKITELPPGTRIIKENDVIKINTAEETIEIQRKLIPPNPKQVGRNETALANGGKTATPNSKEQKQELEKQEAADNLNKANTGSRAIYSGGDDGSTDGSHDTGHSEFEIDYSGLLDPYASSYETTPPQGSNYYDDLETSPSYDFNVSELFETPSITSTRNYQAIPESTVTSLPDGTKILSLKNQPNDGTRVSRFDGKQIVVNNGIPSKLVLKLGDELTQNGITYLVSRSALGGDLELIEQTPEPIEPEQTESLTDAASRYLDDL